MIRILGACTAALLALATTTACGEEVRQLGKAAPVADRAPAPAPRAGPPAPNRRPAAGQNRVPAKQPDAGQRPVVQHRTVVTKRKIPFSVERVRDPSLVEGTRTVRRSGVPGKRALTYRVTWKNGEPVGRELTASKTVREAVDELVAVGTKPAPRPGPPSERLAKAPPQVDDGRKVDGRVDGGVDGDERRGAGRDDGRDADDQGVDSDDDQADTRCHPNYDDCVPRMATDVDCLGGPGNGPRFVRGPVRVSGADVYGLDADNDGTGCED